MIWQETDWAKKAVKFLGELPHPLAWLFSDSQSEPELQPLESDCHHPMPQSEPLLDHRAVTVPPIIRGCYDERMKSKLDSTTTPEQKMQRFQSALGRVLQVSHDEMKQRLTEAEKIRRQTKGKPGPKPSVSGHASDTES